MFFLSTNRLIQHIRKLLQTDKDIYAYINKIVNDKYSEKIDSIIANQRQMSENMSTLISNLTQTIVDSERVIDQKLILLEDELLQKVNKLVDSIYQDDEYLQLVNKTDNNERTNKQLAANIRSKLTDLQSQLDQFKQPENTDQDQVQSIVNTSIKKTRTDIATIISKVKDEIKELDIKLDAFIDTISEKIARPAVKSETRPQKRR